MILVECVLDNPILRRPLECVSGIKIVWEQTYQLSRDSTQMDVWIHSNDFGRVDEAIDDDPSVENREVIAEVSGQKMYRLDLTERGQKVRLMPVIRSADGVLKKAVGENGEWLCQVQLPDRNALKELNQAATAVDLDFAIHRIFEETGAVGKPGMSITPRQRETLNAAIENGYLEIPRDCTLAELGETLGVSESAASERFRRGVKNIIEETIYNPPT
ncbi:MAG: helix-turn-helix domain-containing protein [Natronomonas sp.]